MSTTYDPALHPLTLLVIDDHLAVRDSSTLYSLLATLYSLLATFQRSSTWHHDAMALEWLQAFALEHKLLDKPVFGRLEKPRVAQRDRVPAGERKIGPSVRVPIAWSSSSASLRPIGIRRGFPVLRAVLCSRRTITRDVRSMSAIVARHSSPGRAPHCRSAR
jgi:hypothetical protein